MNKPNRMDRLSSNDRSISFAAWTLYNRSVSRISWAVNSMEWTPSSRVNRIQREIKMFSSAELRTLKAALPVLNSLTVADLETLCSAVVSRMKTESTPSNEKHLGRFCVKVPLSADPECCYFIFLRWIVPGDLLQLNADQLAQCLLALQCIMQACVLHSTKPLVLLKALQELDFSPDRTEKIVSLWAQNAQALTSRSRGNQAIQVNLTRESRKESTRATFAKVQYFIVTGKTTFFRWVGNLIWSDESSTFGRFVPHSWRRTSRATADKTTAAASVRRSSGGPSGVRWPGCMNHIDSAQDWWMYIVGVAYVGHMSSKTNVFTWGAQHGDCVPINTAKDWKLQLSRIINHLTMERLHRQTGVFWTLFFPKRYES